MKKTNPCPLCQGKKFLKIGNFSSRQVVRCQKCGLVQVNPLPPEKEIRDLYSGDYFKNYKEYILNLPVHKAYFRKKLSQIKKEVKGRRKLLDIGCALGVFLEVAQREGFSVLGVDISTFAVSFCQKKGIKAVLGPLKRAGLPKNSFDVVTCFATIEHEREPQALVKRVFEVLKPDGLAVFSTPNHDCLFRKIMRRSWFGYRHKEHLFFFEPKTLRILFEKAGFARIEILKDDARPFPLNYFLKRLAYYYPCPVIKKGEQLLGRCFEKIGGNIPTDPWGDIICLARKSLILSRA